MRKLSFALVLVWLATSYLLHLRDWQPRHTVVSARAGGQRRGEATVAWIEGPTPEAPSHGHLVVADASIDGKLARFASARLDNWADCRLWLEECPTAIQAVARCPGFEPIRLTGAGTSV